VVRAGGRPSSAAEQTAEAPTPRRRRKDIAGMPLGGWIAVAIGILLAIGLGILVYLKNNPR